MGSSFINWLMATWGIPDGMELILRKARILLIGAQFADANVCGDR